MADDETKVDGEAGEEEEKLQCEVEISESGAWKKKISIVIPRSEIDKELNKDYDEFRRTALVPGFRKGRAPRRLVEKRFGEEVDEKAKLRLLTQVFEQIDEDHDFEILGEPDLDIEKIEVPETGDMSFEYEIEVKPEFELPELEGIKVEKPLFEVTDDRVNESLEALQRRAGKLEDVTEGAKEDDMVTADVTMTAEGLEEPETREGVPMRVGSTAVMGVMIEDMGKVLDGAKAGDSKTCSAEAPDTHEKEEVRGKKVEFALEVKEVKRLIPAELNDEFYGMFGVADEAELRERITEDLEDRADREVRGMMKRQINEHLEKSVEFELPEGVAARHANRVLQRRYYELLQEGVPNDQLEENIERLRAASSAESARQLKMSFILEKAADKLEVEVTEGEVNAFIAQTAATYQTRPERLRDQMAKEGRLEQLRDEIASEKVIDRILEMAEVVDAPPVEKAEEKPKKAKKKTSKKAASSEGKAEGESADKDSDTQKVRKKAKRKPSSGE